MKEDPAPAAQDPLLQQVVADKYLLLAKVGHGSMASVYRAQHLLLHNNVAIKVLSAKRLRDGTQVERFKREAQALARVRDERCVSVIDFGNALGTFFIAMEFVDGITLAEELRITGPFETGRALHVLSELLRGLDAIHDSGLIHRDVKPQNIMLTHKAAERDLVKIVDFGIARLLDQDGERTLTAPGMLFGTPEYMSPEQVRGEPLTPLTDVYSAGVVAYQLLLGNNPYRGTDAKDTLKKVAEEPPPPLAHARPDLVIPPGLEELLGRLVAKQPRERFASAAEAAEAVEGLPPAPRPTRVSSSGLPQPLPPPSRLVTPEGARGLDLTAPLPRPTAQASATAPLPRVSHDPVEPPRKASGSYRPLSWTVWTGYTLGFLGVVALSAVFTLMLISGPAGRVTKDAAAVPSAPEGVDATVASPVDAAVPVVEAQRGDASLPDASPSWDGGATTARKSQAPAKEERAKARQLLKQGQRLLAAGKLEQAVQALEAAVAMDDTLAEGHLSLGALYYRRSRFGESRAHYKRYLELRPKAPNAAQIQLVLEALSTAP